VKEVSYSEAKHEGVILAPNEWRGV